MKTKDKIKELIFFIIFSLIIGVFLILIPHKVQSDNSFCVNINEATKEDLEKIIGIGPVLAERIINARPFNSLDELVRVSGIGETKLNSIKEQNLACIKKELIEKNTKEISTLKNNQKINQIVPRINISYPLKNPINEEIKITFSVIGLESSEYDLKISILEKEKNISDIFDEKQEKWQSSHYYLKNVFFGTFFEKNFKLKIKDNYSNFQGQADILIRIRESKKSNYLEFKDKINIIEPKIELKDESKNLISKKGAATISQTSFDSVIFWRNFYFSLVFALFSAILILIIKKKMLK